MTEPHDYAGNEVGPGQQAKVPIKLDPLSPQALMREATERAELLDREIAELHEGLARRQLARAAVGALLDRLDQPNVPDGRRSM